MKRALIVFAITLAMTAPTFADAPTLHLDVRAGGVVDAEQLREALERDLEVRVVMASPDGESPEVIVELTSEGTLRLRIHRQEGGTLSRETAADRDPSGLAITVALLISNLVRDESQELLALLRVETVSTPEPVAEPEPPEPEPQADPEPIGEVALERPSITMPFAIDFVPGLGFSTALLGSDIRGFSFGVVGGLSGGIEGLGFSSVLDIAAGDVRGLQFGGAVSIATGDIEGVSFAGAANMVGGHVDGLAFAGALSVVGGDVRGLQFSGAASIAAGGLSGLQFSAGLSLSGGYTEGLQMGTLNIAADGIAGAQLGVLNLAATTAEGAQLGVTNVSTGPFAGAQLGLLNIAAFPVEGAQLGVTNFSAGPVDGAQIGLLNIAAGPVHGLQLGLVNISERADAAIGLASIQTAGDTEVRAGIDTNGFIGATIAHGSGATHTLFSAQVEPFLDQPAVALGFGFGVRGDVSELLDLDVESLVYVLLDEEVDQDAPDFMTDLNLVLTIRIVDMFAIYGSVGARLYFTQRASAELGAPILETDFGRGNDSLRLWPTIGVGVSLF